MEGKWIISTEVVQQVTGKEVAEFHEGHASSEGFSVVVITG